MASKHLVVVGNGMAGMSCVDAILRKKADFKITVLSEEPYCNYNRILLSSVLAGDKQVDDIYINSPEWYESNGIDLRLGVKATDVNSNTKEVQLSTGEWIKYDYLLLATGSDPFIPSMEGVKLRGVNVFRNISDVNKMIEGTQQEEPGRAIVIGGGLLGLEAAYGLHKRGMKVSVVHIRGHLMEMQLDTTGGFFLKREIERMGIDVLLKRQTTKILGHKKVDGVMFKDGEIVGADQVVIACGIRPNIELAKKAKLIINRGIVVNDYMETSNPSIYAVGECVEHREKVYGLVAPLYEQGKVLAETLAGDRSMVYGGSVPATKLKVMGIELFSAGNFLAKEPESETVQYEDHAFGVYKKVVIQAGKVVGTILIGDAVDSNRILEMIRSDKRLSDQERQNVLFANPPEVPGSANDVMSKDNSETICGCIGVTKGDIVTAIQEKGLKTLSEVKECTKASTGCGTCACDVESILKNVAGNDYQEVKKEVVCECIPYPKDQLRTMIQTQKIKSVQDLLEIYGNSKGCAVCKPALSYIVDEVNCGSHKEDRSARFINDRVHANIQKDGSFSVIPRMRGGVTSPEELRKIADVAVKYKAKMVKVTGSQRLDLLGVKKEDLPKIWSELGMPSGHAYAKAVRMVKTCVGTDFCRYGTQNSIKTGIQLEKDLEGLYTPGKLKMGVVGCPRNCAEATVKDIGLVGIEGGWQVVIGGAAGKVVRAADILTTVETAEEALTVAKLFFQYYRENGEYLERTYDFVERVGLETIKQKTILASKEEKSALLDRLAKAKSKVVDPWEVESKEPFHPKQFESLVLPQESEALLV